MTETSCAVSAPRALADDGLGRPDGNLLISSDRFDSMKIVDGHITLPDRPGLGVVPL
ncbi:MAG: hypothetical protein ACLR76_06485 [Alistipes sp.]